MDKRGFLLPKLTITEISSDHPSEVRIQYGWYDSPLGSVLLASQNHQLCNLFFHETADQSFTMASAEFRLSQYWQRAQLVYDQGATEASYDAIFGSPVLLHPLPVLLRGTEFQRQVWHALLSIPLGKTSTYRAIAKAIGRPTATRAVGTAVGKNPIAFVIPCHRVIRQSGALGGYRWGLDCKQRLLEWEAQMVTPMQPLREGARTLDNDHYPSLAGQAGFELIN